MEPKVILLSLWLRGWEGVNETLKLGHSGDERKGSVVLTCINKNGYQLLRWELYRHPISIFPCNSSHIIHIIYIYIKHSLKSIITTIIIIALKLDIDQSLRALAVLTKDPSCFVGKLTTTCNLVPEEFYSPFWPSGTHTHTSTHGYSHI